MTSGIYKRDNVILGAFKKGDIPHNKGIQNEIVLKKIESFKNGQPIFCKKHDFHIEWRLHSHNNVQCKKCCKEIQIRDRKNNPIKYLIRDAKQHSKKKNLDFNITENDILNILIKQNNKCALSAISFDEEKMSLDRIDSALGYIKDNVQLLTINVNIMKSNFEQDYFIKICEQIAYFKSNQPKKKR